MKLSGVRHEGNGLIGGVPIRVGNSVPFGGKQLHVTVVSLVVIPTDVVVLAPVPPDHRGGKGVAAPAAVVSVAALLTGADIVNRFNFDVSWALWQELVDML